MLEFRRQPDAKEAETQGRGAAAWTAGESSTGGIPQGQAQENALGPEARGVAGVDRGRTLVDAASSISPLGLAIAGIAAFAASSIVLGSFARITLSPLLGWLLVVVAVLGLVTFIFGLLRRVTALQAESLARAVELKSVAASLATRLAAAENARLESEALLFASPSPLLAIDAAYQIQASYSVRLEAFFRLPSLRDENFLNILRRVLPEPRFRVARDYLAGLFDPERGEAELVAANPLEEVEIMLLDSDAASVPRTLSFAFRRVGGGPAIERVLVVVDDVTEELRRQRQSRIADATKAKQFEMLSEIVGVRPATVASFISAAREELRGVDGALRVGDLPLATRSGAFRERVGEILRRVRAIKRYASQADLPYFERCAAAYEHKVEEIEAREPLGGDDFLGLVMEQSAFRAELDDLQSLRLRLATPKATREGDLPAHVAAFAQRLAAEAGKEVVVDIDGFDVRLEELERGGLIRDVLEELTRNAVAHGIESPERRSAAGKRRAGRILIRHSRDAAHHKLSFSFRDDGAGLDVGALRQRAVDGGLLDLDAASELEPGEAAGFVFAPELSRGMSEVKRRVVDEAGGSISVDSESGAFCEFSFVLPAR